MSNIALGKKVIESVKRPEIVTNGQILGYDAHNGFTYFRWPGPITVDLEYESSIFCIRFLLWDNKGHKDNTRNPRFYMYRLAISSDMQNWEVLYDTAGRGYNGWQVFVFPEKIQARYIRIYGLWDSANFDFHIVEIEVHDSEPPDIDAECILYKEILSSKGEIEFRDGMPITYNLEELVNKLEKFKIDNPIINQELFSELISDLRVRVNDISAIEQNMNTIRRSVIGPVKDDLARIGKYNVFGFIIGIIGGVLAIATLVLNLFG